MPGHATLLLDAGAAPDAALRNDHELLSERLEAVLACRRAVQEGLSGFAG